MKRLSILNLLALCALAFILPTPAPAAAWKIDGYENADKDRGQWAWFVRQARECADPIPAPGSYTRAEWREMLTTAKDGLPCKGAALSSLSIKHVFLFLHEHASDSNNPVMQKPGTCGF